MDGASSSATSTTGAARSAIARMPPRGRRQQVAAKPADHVGDVAAALAQVLVAHLREDGAELVEGAVKRPLGVHAVGCDDPPGARHQQVVVEHEHLRLEQAGKIGARPLRDACMDGSQLRRAGLAGLVEAADFPLDARTRRSRSAWPDGAAA